MEVIIDKSRYTLSQPIAGGGEGEVYALTDDFAVKVYHSDILEQSPERKQKVLSLCNAYLNNVSQFGQEHFAFPQHPAHKKNLLFNDIIGFSMPFFKNCLHIVEFNYDINSGEFRSPSGYQFNDQTALEFIYDIFDLIGRLHKGGIILGDINPKNILCDWTSILGKPKPVFIDLDAVQFGQFDCAPAFSEDYIDPLIEKLGKKPNNSYMYSSESDIFSLACLAYSFFVGVHPYSIRTRPPCGMSDNKINKVSVIRFIEEGESYLKSLGLEYLDGKNNRDIINRLKSLKNLDNNLYEFFVSVFSKDERKNLIFSLPINNPRNPKFVFFQESGIGKVLSDHKRKKEQILLQEKQKKLEAKAMPYNPTLQTTQIPRSKQPIRLQPDPPEFILFIKNYGINYNQMITG